MSFKLRPDIGTGKGREQTREELLANVKNSRAEREESRARARSALVIQRYWRGHRARKSVWAGLLIDWAKRWGPVVAAAQEQIRAVDVADRLLPPLLFALLPSRGQTAAASIIYGTPLKLSNAPPQRLNPPSPSASSREGAGTTVNTGVEAAARAAVIAALTDPEMIRGTSRESEDVVAAGSGEDIASTSKVTAASALSPSPWSCVQAALSLLIRTMSSTEDDFNYLSLALHRDQQVRQQWHRTARRLAHLCCSIIASAPDDASTGRALIVDAAAARVLTLLVDETLWKFQTAKNLGSETCMAATRQLLSHLATQPAPLFSALTRVRLASQSTFSGPNPPSGTPSTATPTPPVSTPSALPRLLKVAMKVLLLDSQGIMLPYQGPSPTPSRQCILYFVRFVLLAPRLCDDICDSLCSSSMLTALSAGVTDLCRAPGSTSISATEAVWGLANLTLLVVGPGTETSISVGSKNHKIRVLSSLQQISDPAVAMAYCVAATHLILAMAYNPLSNTPQPAGGNLDQIPELWQLGQRGLLEALQEVLAKQPCGLEVFCGFCTALLVHLPAAAQKLGSTSGPRVLEALAFSPKVLPSLWKSLCYVVGLPLSTSQEATYGLDVLSLSAGPAGLAPWHALMLGLFCRIYSHLLLVLDDLDFFTTQAPLDLRQNCAVAVSLNSLVFHTYFPKPVQRVRVMSEDEDDAPILESMLTVPPPQLGDPASLLTEYAPLVHRHLYERNIRRSFCPANLWWQPYKDMFYEVGGVPTPTLPGGDPLIGPFSMYGVLQALGLGQAGEQDLSQSILWKSIGMRPAAMAALLRVAPHTVPFEQRLSLFRQLLKEDHERGRWHLPIHEGGHPQIKITIRRDHLLEDAFSQLSHLGPQLKARLAITFIGQDGTTEAGLDFGGLTKEFLESAIKTALDPNYGLFLPRPEGLVAFSPQAESVPGGLALICFVGLLLGKAMHEGLLLDIALAPTLVSRVLGRSPSWDDLATFDKQLYKTLQQVKHYDGDVSDLGLSFCVEEEALGVRQSYDLIPSGSTVPVTCDNVLLYCHLMAAWHVGGRVGRAVDAFAAGLGSIIPLQTLKMFTPAEVNELISGGREVGLLDVEEMKAYTQYSGGYTATSSTIKLFWQVVAEFNPSERAALLRFVTSVSRPPLGGFAYLQPPLTIHKVDCDASVLAFMGGKDVDRLPSASTCYNMLKLPNYRRASTMKTKLLYAINSGSGFHLS